MANYPVPYQNSFGYSGVGQQMYPQYSQYPQQSMAAAQMQQAQTQQSGMGLKWVDGEIGAKAYQIPAGWPSNQPIALWDTNDTVIYLKSVNPMGMPNPLQKARYTIETSRGGESGRGYSGESEIRADMSEFVRKDDMEQMKQELMEAISNVNTGGASGARKTSAKGE